MGMISRYLAFVPLLLAIVSAHAEQEKAPPAWRTNIHVAISSPDASGAKLFYIALPFNDLTHPRLAKKWVPGNWIAPVVDGKPVSACQGQWIEIKNGDGIVCYAQWKGIGPVHSDDADYVFGNAAPKAAMGAKVSHEVALHLGLGMDASSQISWRFIDASDVVPGPWLRHLEQAIVLKAIGEADQAKKIPVSTSHPSDSESSLRALYLDAYLAIGTGQNFQRKGNLKEARDTLAKALDDFESIRTKNYLWNTALVSARVKDLEAAISDVSNKIVATASLKTGV